MDEYSYGKLFEKANKAQELFVKFMEDCGYNFLAGDRNGKTLNIDVIEEICNCSYVAPNTLTGRHGPKLSFFRNGRKQNYTMPDELFLIQKENSSINSFFDVKNRTETSQKEKFLKIKEYAMIEEYSGIDVSIVVVIWNRNEKGFDFYSKNAKTIVKENWNLEDRDWVYFDLNRFHKMNKRAVPPLR